VIKVIDGDTVKFEVGFLPKELGSTLGVRQLGIDTPEKAPRAKCEKEAELGKKATEFTKAAVSSAKSIDVQVKEWDKYGGRVLGHILLDGKDLGKLLIDAKLARPYFGEKKSDWCNDSLIK
jgi:endonuclease YncB( thermonuclease family)